MIRNFTLAALVTAFLAYPVTAATWYVDDDNYGKSALDGKSEAKAFGTIQEAVDAAQAEDTIIVLPGEYNRGSKIGAEAGTYHQQTRVVVDKKLTIKSRDGRETTHVVGKWDLTASSKNDQVNSVSGFFVKTAASGTIIEGFTIRDCGQQSFNAGEMGGGGAVATENTSYNTDCYVVYSAISNCCAYRGGGMRGGVAIGTRFSNNICFSNQNENHANSSAAHYIHAYNCIFTDNGINRVNSWTPGSTYAVCDPGIIINCTFVNTAGRMGLHSCSPATSVSGHYYNVVNYENEADSNNNHGDSNAVACNVYWAANATPDWSFASGSTNANTFAYTSDIRTNLCVCPVLGDFRPVKGGLLDGAGNKDYTTSFIIPEQYRNRDFYGNALTSSKIPIGAILPAAEVKTAAFHHTSDYKLRYNGIENVATRPYLQAAEYPFNVEVENSVDNPTARWVGISIFLHARIMGYNEKVQLFFPPKKNPSTGVDFPVTDFSSLVCTYTKYVGGSGASDTTGDGTSAKPYATIQAAVNDAEVKEKGKLTLISVRPGVYNTGSEIETRFGSGMATRIFVPNNTYVLIRAESSSPADTIIEGAPDPATIGDSVEKGCGTGATRIFVASTSASAYLQGFTLRKGYSGSRKSSGSTSVYYAGACRGGGDNQQIYDCVITDCHGNCSAMNQVWAIRCLFTNNVIGCSGDANGVVVNMSSSSCIFANNVGFGSGYQPLASSGHAFNCTIYEPSASSGVNVYNAQAKIYNTIIAAGGNAPKEHTSDPNKLGRLAGSVVKALSDPAKDVGYSNFHGSAALANPAAMDFRPATISKAAEISLACDDSGAMNAIPLETTIMRSYCTFDNKSLIRDDGTLVSGAINDLREIAGVYVSPTGNDANNGSTESLAKKTFASAFAAALSGDYIVALPGVYDYETMTKYGNNRVVVPESVLLKSRDGAETTTIKGVVGDNPIRCVYLERGATIQGFTLLNGSSCLTTADTYDSYSGGALGIDKDSATICDSIITGCWAQRGGGAAYATLNRCRVLGNKCGMEASGAMHVNAYNCFFNNNIGNVVMTYFYDVINCTFGTGNNNAGGSNTHILLEGRDGSRLWNVVDLTPYSANTLSISKTDARNCFFPKGMNITFKSAENVNQENTLSTLQGYFTADGVPYSVKAPVVDKGLANEYVGEFDVVGNERVRNRQIDIGAYEADWAAAYSEVLGAGVSVNEVSGTVKKLDDGISLLDGDNLEIAFTSSRASGKAKISYTLSQGATLVVTVDGVVTEITDGNSFSFAWNDGKADISLVAMNGAVDLGKFRKSGGMAFSYK